tara:strand:+ start:878 stop:2101 length:1224 start_codon:yes stop_codon:yes gene_type:complete
MRIALGKIGKSIKFGPEEKGTGKKAMTAGSIDARIIFQTLIKFNPEDTFYLIGRSNFSRLKPEVRKKVDPHGNVIDVWAKFKDWFDNQDDKDEVTESWRYIEHVIETEEKFDLGIFIAGGVLEYAVQGKTLKDGKPIKTLMAAAKYAGPIHHFINETKIPYMVLSLDPRCYPKPAKDILIPPKRILQLINETVEVEHRVSYESNEMIVDKVPAVYSGIETLYVVEEEESAGLDAFFDEPEYERDINMVLWLNEGKPSRYNDLKNFILDSVEDVQVYGVWNEKALKDPRIEQVAMSELSWQFPRTKYTFCIPIAPGWATGKFWEMIKHGIIPFMHPTYDEQKNIGFPEELRVKDSNDLLEKINLYNGDEMLYNRLHKQLKDMITPDKKSGKYMNDIIMKNAEEVLNGK